MTKLFVTTLICASLMCVVRGSPPTTTTPMLLSRIQLIANKNNQSVILEAVHRHFSPNDINFVINRLIRGGATSALAERLVNRLINLVFESTVFGPVYASHVDLHVMHMIDELKDASVNPVELVIQRIKVIDEILPKSRRTSVNATPSTRKTSKFRCLISILFPCFSSFFEPDVVEPLRVLVNQKSN